MADQPTPLGDPYEEGTLTPEEQAAQAEVVALLGSLDFLRPDSSGPSTPMPDGVWARLESSLAGQAAVPAPIPADGPAVRRRTRWASGLVAASIAVVAVGIGATVLRQGSTSSETVTAATAPSATAPLAASAEAFAAPGASDGMADAPGSEAAKAEQAAPLAGEPAAGDAGDSTPAPSPPTIDLRVAGEPPARVVLASSTNYTPEDLPGQVSSLFASMGVDSASEAMAMPVEPVSMPVADGFTSSWQALRDCVTWLTESPDEQALVVDRARFLGNDAGVVVAPGDDGPALGEEAESATSASPSPTFTVNALVGSLDVWVVDPACTKSVGSIREYLDYRWQE